MDEVVLWMNSRRNIKTPKLREAHVTLPEVSRLDAEVTIEAVSDLGGIKTAQTYIEEGVQGIGAVLRRSGRSWGLEVEIR